MKRPLAAAFLVFLAFFAMTPPLISNEPEESEYDLHTPTLSVLPDEGIYSQIRQQAADISDPQRKLEFLVDQTWRNRNSMPDLSLELGHRAIELADSLHDYYNLVKAHSFTGVAYRLLGDYNKAIEIFFEGLSLAKKHMIPQQEGYAHINIANLYIYMEFYNQALESLTPAMEIAKEIEDYDMLSYVFLNQGRVLMHMEDTERAIENITYSLNLRKETGNEPGQAVCYKYLGDIYFNRQEFNEAFKSYDLALSTIDKMRDRHLYGNILLKKAQINCKNKSFSEAEPFALEAFSIGEEVNSRLLIHDALKVLSKVDMEKNDFITATRRLLTINEYADTLFNQQLSEKILSMEFQLERQRQQAEMDIIKRDKEIQQLRFSRQRYLTYTFILFTALLTISGTILLVFMRKLRQKNQLLSTQKEELKQINASKDQMFMVIGHDLRGPLWNLRALIELIKEDEDEFTENERRDNFNALSRSVQSVSDLLENLLFWAKSQDGKMVFNPVKTDLKKLALKSIRPYISWAEMKNVKINIYADEEKHPVIADENMIQAVIRNFLSNAIKYSFKNSNIDVSIKTLDNALRFSVTDHGIGMPQERTKEIFSNEIISSSKGTGNEVGSGIGLGLSKEFISRHKGKINAVSAPGKGTEFSFELPLSN